MGPKKRSISGASKSSGVSTHSQGQASVNQSAESGSEDLDIEVDDVQNKAGENIDPADPKENLEGAEEPTNENGGKANRDENNGDGQRDVEEPTKQHRNLKNMLDLPIENCGKEETNVNNCMTALN